MQVEDVEVTGRVLTFVAEKAGSRYADALFMRSKGCTYQAIARHFSVSVERARQLVKGALRKARVMDVVIQPDEFDSLPVWVRNGLRAANYTTRGQVLEAVNSGRLSLAGDPRARIPNVGRKGLLLIAALLGVKNDAGHPTVSREVIESAISILKECGYTVKAPR